MSSNGNKHVELEVIDVNEIESTPEERKGKTLNLLWFLLYFVCIFSICLVIVTFLVQRSIVEGSAMEPTLSDNQSVLVNKLAYTFGSPKRYDLIAFKYDNTNNVHYVRRVIGLPGEKIQIKDGYVYINDVKLEDDKYGKELIKDAGLASEPIILSDNEYFVLSDNRSAGDDSRSVEVGKVHKNQIIGKVNFRILPLGKFGGVS